MSRAERERATAFFADPEALADVCAVVAKGGTLYDWSRKQNVAYHLVYAWLHDDPEHLKVYSKALENRISSISDRVISGFLRIAEADPRSAFNSDGSLLSIKEIPDELAMSLSSFEVDTKTDDNGKSTSTGRVRLDSRAKGLEALGRSVGLFRERVEITGKNGEALGIPVLSPEQLIQYANDRMKGGKP